MQHAIKHLGFFCKHALSIFFFFMTPKEHYFIVMLGDILMLFGIDAVKTAALLIVHCHVESTDKK